MCSTCRKAFSGQSRSQRGSLRRSLGLQVSKPKARKVHLHDGPLRPTTGLMPQDDCHAPPMVPIPARGLIGSGCTTSACLRLMGREASYSKESVSRWCAIDLPWGQTRKGTSAAKVSPFSYMYVAELPLQHVTGRHDRPQGSSKLGSWRSSQRRGCPIVRACIVRYPNVSPPHYGALLVGDGVSLPILPQFGCDECILTHVTSYKPQTGGKSWAKPLGSSWYVTPLLWDTPRARGQRVPGRLQVLL